MTADTGKRVLIVEDEVLVGMHLEDLILQMGHSVIGPATYFAEAMELAKTSHIDFAVMDVNLAGTLSFPIADILRKRRIPFVFATGYGREGLAAEYHNIQVLRKPYAVPDLQAAVLNGLRTVIL